MPRRCFMPFEYVPVRRSTASAMPTRSISPSMRRSSASPSRPFIRPVMRRFSRPVISE